MFFNESGRKRKSKNFGRRFLEFGSQIVEKSRKMFSLKKYKLFPSNWHRSMTAREMRKARSALECYATNKDLDTGLKEQFAIYDDFYPDFQDILLSMKDHKESKEEESPELLGEWIDQLKAVDKTLRERLFIMTIAAEEGWRVASEVAFSKKGNYADKDLAKALKNEKKRKKDEDEKRPKRKRFTGNRFRPYQLQNQPAPPQSVGGGGPAAPQLPSTSYQGRRIETRACLSCGQVGHLYRNCPRNNLPAAQGAAPKKKEDMNKGDDYLQGQDDLGIQESGLREEISLDGIVKNQKEEEEKELFNEFMAGAIHEPKVFSFWENDLKAGPWLLNVIKNGYEIPFRENPSRYYEKNNKSARDNMKIVRSIVAEMISMGVVQAVKEKPWCVSPLGLVSKIKEDGSWKHRLVWDASRHVNCYVPDLPVKLQHLSRALEMTEQGEWQGVFDLSSCYYHINVVEHQRKFLGASIENSDGSTLYFHYCNLPFGLSSAVHIVTKIWKPISRYLSKLGIKNSIFIDDGRILAKNAEELESYRRITYRTVARAGWTIEKTKSDQEGDGAQVKNYLGFTIDSTSMRVTAPVKKLVKVKESVSEIVKCPSVKVKRLAAALGRIIALEPSHGFLAKVTTRSGYAALAAHVESRGWKGSVPLDEETAKEFKFFLQWAVKMNGCMIPSSLREIRIDSLIKNPRTRVQSVRCEARPDILMVSDSSDFKAFAYELQGKEKQTEFMFYFNEQEKSLSSGGRELQAVLKTLKHWRAENKIRSKRVYWMTDSTNLVSFLEKGSKSPEVQKLLFELVIVCQELDIKITPLHLFREDPRIQEADEGSKIPDNDNWSLSVRDYEDIEKSFQFETDVFADSINKKTPASSNWSALGVLYLCPPVSLLIRCAQRIRSCKCEGLIVLPEWHTAPFLSFYMTKEGVPREPFRMWKRWKPYVIQNENARNTALFGEVEFYFLALEFRNLL